MHFFLLFLFLSLDGIIIFTRSLVVKVGSKRLRVFGSYSFRMSGFPSMDGRRESLFFLDFRKEKSSDLACTTYLAASC